MMPTIYTVSAEGSHIHSPSAVSETIDSTPFTYQGLANKPTAPRQGGESMARQIWNDFMEDVMGPKRGSKH